MDPLVTSALVAGGTSLLGGFLGRKGENKQARFAEAQSAKQMAFQERIYADFSGITDLSDALHQIKEAQEEFLNVPSEIREKFQNDAGQFFKFASNPDNLGELREMGLANPEQSVAMPTEQPIPDPVEPQNSKGQE